MLEILNATEHEHLEQVRSLMHAFVDWLHQHYANDRQIINEYFDEKAFTEELALLPGKYATPNGQLLLARHQEQPAGCVAIVLAVKNFQNKYLKSSKTNEYICLLERAVAYLGFSLMGVSLS